MPSGIPDGARPLRPWCRPVPRLAFDGSFALPPLRSLLCCFMLVLLWARSRCWLHGF